MPTDYIAEGKEAFKVGVLAAVILLLVNGVVTAVSNGVLTISTDILGVVQAVTAGNYSTAVGLIIGIFFLGVAIRLVPAVRGYLGV